jgi:hypothetical protein
MRHAMPESMDEGGARRAVLKRRDGVVVCRAGELGAVLGEASYVLAETPPWLLLAVTQLPLLAGVHVCALEVVDEDPTQVVQSLILSRGKWSSHMRAESPR